MEKVFRNCVSKITTSKYKALSMTLQPFVDKMVLKNYIEKGQITKLRLIKNAIPNEHGTGMKYTETELIYKKPREGKLYNILYSIVDNSFRGGQVSNIKLIDDFEPDVMKFEVETEFGIKTYSSGNPNIGVVQEEMPNGVVGADGETNGRRILSEMKRIYEEQHML